MRQQWQVPPGVDPRTLVTPDAFQVDEALLGTPLATPLARAGAMAIDLVLVALLSNAQPVFLGLAAGVFFFRIAWKGRKDDPMSAVARSLFGCMGAVFLFVVIVTIWAQNFLDPDDFSEFTADIPVSESEAMTLSVADAINAAALLRSDDSVEASDAATSLIDGLAADGFTPSDMRVVLDEFVTENDESVGTLALTRAIDRIDTVAVAAPEVTPELPPDSLLARYTSARLSADSATEAELRPAVVNFIAADEIAAREARIADLRDRARRLEDQRDQANAELEEAEDRGLITMLRNVADELGIGIGWAGLYFTVFLGFWRGQTPGKRLFRIRVVRLDGKPLTWWDSFERFGGYAAGVFTGMAGYFQVFWDRNRQALQDKVVETVVIKQRITPVDVPGQTD